jgi:predicted  nucleic acid-binding Zn-ribbon protein
MSDMTEDYKNVQNNQSSPTWHLPAIVILALLALGGLGWAWNNSNKLDATKQAFMDQMKSVQTGVQQDVSSLKDRIAQDEKANTDLQGDLKVVTDKLKITQGQLKKARQEAAEQITQTSDKITALDTSVHTELATKATSDDVKTVDTKVTAVSSNLDKTISDLNMAKSELGTLIARNHDEIDLLRRKGERDYYEFTIAGKNKPQKVGNVTVELKGTNEKKNRVNQIVTVEDKRFEDKNRPVNQPMIFYLSGSHQAEELIINKVGKNEISGYLSVPKATTQQPVTAASSSKSSGN